uniref:Excalibur domain-containing protein n=1 Tax=uncultured marine thaumarchaeote KM3_04_H11 TaxID=1455968 RepID=A0A075G2J2_9ARCH|nr:Excalibur domain-containing protein [uncultured marine thaumarchaeote KM3_04_H11]
MNPIRRYYVVPIVIAIVSIIVVFGFGSSDTTPENIEPVFMGYDGQITRVIDGDTLIIDLTTIRLSLVNSPERDERGYQEAKDFASTVCPVGANAEFYEDTWQPVDKYGRSVGLVYCNDMMLNELLLTNGHAEISTYYCDKSEFGSEGWARAYGC